MTLDSDDLKAIAMVVAFVEHGDHDRLDEFISDIMGEDLEPPSE